MCTSQPTANSQTHTTSLNAFHAIMFNDGDDLDISYIKSPLRVSDSRSISRFSDQNIGSAFINPCRSKVI